MRFWGWRCVLHCVLNIVAKISGVAVAAAWPSVAGVLTEAVAKVANHEVVITASGRTDSGVHALGQIVHVDVRSERSMHQWLMGINYALLPDTVSVRWVQSVVDDFHARFSAKVRRLCI